MFGFGADTHLRADGEKVEEQTEDAHMCMKFLRKWLPTEEVHHWLTPSLNLLRGILPSFARDVPSFRSLSRLLAEEEEKMKALMSLQEEQEEYIQKTQREKQELKQEMEAKSRSLEEAHRQLEEVRANRHRVDQDVVVRGGPSVHHGQAALAGSSFTVRA